MTTPFFFDTHWQFIRSQGRSRFKPHVSGSQLTSDDPGRFEIAVMKETPREEIFSDESCAIHFNELTGDEYLYAHSIHTLST